MALMRRSGETDEEYEARKRRVKRTRQLSYENFFAHHGGGRFFDVNPTNTCLTSIEIDDVQTDVIGYDTGLNIGEGVLSGDLVDEEFYGFTWNYPAGAGLFKIRWGVDGLQQLASVSKLLLKDSQGNDAGVAEWDSGENAYLITNQPMANQLNGMYDAGQIPPFCFLMTLLPAGVIIKYTFSELVRSA